MNTEKILRLQREEKECKTVYAVYIRCDDEDAVDAIWETQGAAEMHRDNHNGMRGNKAGYYGRARVVPMKIRTEAMARDWFNKPAAETPTVETNEAQCNGKTDRNNQGESK